MLKGGEMTTLLAIIFIAYLAYTAGLLSKLLRDKETIEDIYSLSAFVPVPVAAMLGVLALLAVCAAWPIIMVNSLWKERG